MVVVTWASSAIPALTTRADASANTLTPTTTTGKVLYMRITAYSSTPNQTDSTPFTTADGATVHDGVVATNLLPFGTKIKIPALFGDKVFTVEDRTALRIKNTIDIWMPSKKKALIFGANNADVVIMGKNNGTNGTLAEGNGTAPKEL